jgi:hypothetical protein
MSYAYLDEPYWQLVEQRPVHKALHLPFEMSFHPRAAIDFAKNHWEVPVLCLAAYALFCYFGQKVMKDRKPFNLQLSLALWNLFLSVFSFIGMIRTVPHLLANISSMPFEDTICKAPLNDWGSGPTGLWVALFIFSKIPELIDTAFIVLRKKPLIFLHWYHHITVLLYCWHAYATEAGSGLYFVAMNYSVHAIMYGYYCLMALKVVPKWFPSYLITIAQIAQMFVGTGVCISSWYFMLKGRECANNMENLIAGGLMYGSYLYLFVQFALQRFVFKKDKRKKLE